MKQKFSKTIFSVVLAVLLVFSTAAPAFAATETVISENISYEYDTTAKTTTVVGYKESLSGDVVIPSAIEVGGEKYNVTSIGDYAFYNCTGLTSIEIPDSVTSIGVRAFNYCTSLTSIEIPDSVTSIGYAAFGYCTGLTSIEIPDGVTSIEGYTFSDCTSLESIVIPDSVTSIRFNAFDGCTSLENIEIPNSVTSIESYTFYNCTSLTSIEIPNSVTSIGVGAFIYCTSLTSIEIPDSVTSIEDGTFGKCTSLESIEIPNSVTFIGGLAFSNCTSLKNAYFPVNASLGEDLFLDTDQPIDVWYYDVLKSADESTDGKTHVEIVDLKDKKGDVITESRVIEHDDMGDRYVINEVIPESILLNHTLIKTEAKAPTCTQEGNIAYWTCENCDKYFSDENGSTSTTFEEIIIKATGHSYENGKCTVCGANDPDFKVIITAGANGTWQRGSKEGLSFTSSAEFADFIKVQVDGKDINASSYTVKEGSTIVTLNADYLETLSVGSHTLSIVSASGTATTNFTVAAGQTAGDTAQQEPAGNNETITAVQTGDENSILTWITVLFVAGSGIMLINKKRRCEK